MSKLNNTFLNIPISNILWKIDDKSVIDKGFFFWPPGFVNDVKYLDLVFKVRVVPIAVWMYGKYPNLVRTQVEIISDPNYLVRILFER